MFLAVREYGSGYSAPPRPLAVPTERLFWLTFSETPMNRLLPRLLLTPAMATLFLWMIVPLVMTLYFAHPLQPDAARPDRFCRAGEL